MKTTKRKACLDDLLLAGVAGLSRLHFDGNRTRYGTSFMRRLQELEEEYIIEKQEIGGFLTHWTLIGSRNRQPQAAMKGREIYIGSVAGMEFYEVCQ